jgi:hypothetical protein
MIDVIFPKRAPTPRERDSRPVPNDYRPKQMRAVGVESDGYYEELGGQTFLDGSSLMHKLEDELSRNRLNEIAALVRALTYGEMMDLAHALWKIRPDGAAAVDQSTLPMMLHLWSTSASLDAEPSDVKTSDERAAE